MGEEANEKVSKRITDSVMQIKCFKATGTLEHSTAQQKKTQGNATFQTLINHFSGMPRLKNIIFTLTLTADGSKLECYYNNYQWAIFNSIFAKIPWIHHPLSRAAVAGLAGSAVNMKFVQCHRSWACLWTQHCKPGWACPSLTPNTTPSHISAFKNMVLTNRTTQFSFFPYSQQATG